MAGGDSASGYPSNLSPAMECRPPVYVFSIFASHTFEIATGTLFKMVLGQNKGGGTKNEAIGDPTAERG